MLLAAGWDVERESSDLLRPSWGQRPRGQLANVLDAVANVAQSLLDGFLRGGTEVAPGRMCWRAMAQKASELVSPEVSQDHRGDVM